MGLPAEDVGKLSDNNFGEAIARIPRADLPRHQWPSR